MQDPVGAMQDPLLDGQLRLLEMLAMGESLENVLTATLKFCESHSAGMLCSILLVDRAGKRLHHGSAPSLPPEYMRRIDGSAIGPRAGSCGTAAFLGKQVIVEDIDTDPLWTDYRKIAAPFGLRACWSTPILGPDQQVLGTFAMYYRRPNRPTSGDLHLIGVITHVAALALRCRRAEEERRQVFERISDAFVALDGDWKYTYVNPKAGAFFGREPSSLIGKHIWTEFPEGVGQKFHLAYEKAMKEQIPIVFEDFYPPWGRWFENRIYPSPQGLSIYFHDISERRRAEEKIRQSEKMTALGQLAGGIAHDFNNQLSVMLGYAGLLENRLTDPDLKRFASSIVRAADRSGDLTRNLLSFSRQGHIESVPIDVHDLIVEVIELLGHSLDRRILISKRLDSGLAQVLGDPASLQNALLNLALNSRDAMPGGGRLEFSTEVAELPGVAGFPGDRTSDRDAFPPGPRKGLHWTGPEEFSDMPAGAYLHITVSDDGTGMTEEVRKRIFEPFFTTKPVGKGTGMGMASVFGTVKTHRGRILVESEVGRGTRFHIYLPLLPSAGEAGTQPKPSPAFTRDLRVLVVEDEVQIRELISDMLKAGGHTVIGASGGLEALECFRERWREIDLVILDMIMGDIDGYQTFQELKRIDPEAKVILSSGFSPEGKIEALLDEGAQGLLQKPYGKEQLDRMIAAVMGSGAK
ncbi:MAG: domain S-box protein [Fibrobacteres bacterium]|nr:domain S-box protein [Fibrobacterota bacterium]